MLSRRRTRSRSARQNNADAPEAQQQRTSSSFQLFGERSHADKPAGAALKFSQLFVVRCQLFFASLVEFSALTLNSRAKNNGQLNADNGEHLLGEDHGRDYGSGSEGAAREDGRGDDGV
jgi:hypothetical protein